VVTYYAMVSFLVFQGLISSQELPVKMQQRFASYPQSGGFVSCGDHVKMEIQFSKLGLGLRFYMFNKTPVLLTIGHSLSLRMQRLHCDSPVDHYGLNQWFPRHGSLSPSQYHLRIC
jgi:hypothetical protein